MRSLLLTSLLIALNACKSRPAVPIDAATADSQGQVRFEHCVTLKGPPTGTVKGFKLAGVELTHQSFYMKPRESAAGLPARRGLKLGIIADTRQALPKTLTNLDYFRDQFAKAAVDAIVILGGLDTSFEGATELVHRLAGVIPVLALPGDQLSLEGFQATTRQFERGVLDLSQIRAIYLPPIVSLVAVPGYHLVHHLAAGYQGCSYTAAEIDGLAQALADAPTPRMLLSYGPPRGRGPKAVDRAFGDVNAGDPKLRDLMAAAKFRFGVFAHIHESAGHATTTSGRPVRPNRWSESLLLNVGSADGVPHENLRGHWSPGTAAIFEIKQGRARYRMLEAPNRFKDEETPSLDMPSPLAGRSS